MRVPIYPDDLQPSGGFKKLARSLQKRWPGQKPVQQMLVNEILSKGLGYPGYFEVRDASLTSPLGTPTPSATDICVGIAAAISEALTLANDSSVPSTALGQFVETLPFKALTTFKRSAGGQQGAASQSPPPGSNPVADAGNSAPVISSSTSPAIRQEGSRRKVSSFGVEDYAHIEAIKQFVTSSGSLRDQSLLAMLEMGLRGQVIRDTKVSTVLRLDAELPAFSVAFQKANASSSAADISVIGRYISAENLSADDYLFPGEDRNQPMSSDQLLQTFRSWERRARLQPSNHTPHLLRALFVARLHSSTRERGSMAGWVDHNSSQMSKYYLRHIANASEKIGHQNLQ